MGGVGGGVWRSKKGRKRRKVATGGGWTTWRRECQRPGRWMLQGGEVIALACGGRAGLPVMGVVGDTGGGREEEDEGGLLRVKEEEGGR
jgi:hypothetical protein